MVNLFTNSSQSYVKIPSERFLDISLKLIEEYKERTNQEWALKKDYD